MCKIKFLDEQVYVLTHIDETWSLALDFDQKVKVWLSSVQLIFHSWPNFKYQSNALWNELNHAIRLRLYIWILGIMFQTNKSCISSKPLDQSNTIKTLILTILPFWWSDQISCGVVVQIWSNGSYEFIMLMWVKNHEVWL